MARPSGKRLAWIACGIVAAAAAVGAGAWYLYSQAGQVDRLANSSRVKDRMEAAGRLERESGAAARRLLRRLSADPEPRVALKAVWTLGRRPDEDGLDDLAEIAHDRQIAGEVRGEAAAEYGRQGGADAKLLAEMLRRDDDPEARAGAAKGLSFLADPNAAAAMVAGLSDPDRRVRLWAITGIHKLITPRLPYQAELEPPRQQRQIEAIKDYLGTRGVSID